MASYHCTVKTGGKGRAAKHADYIEREGQYAQTPGRESKLEDLEHKASGNMPAWAEHDASVFWQAADEHERSNGATYREIEVALPRELTPAQRVELVEDFVKQQIGERHPFTYAIHIPKAAIEKGEQPHAHIMYSERTLDGIARDPDKFFKRANTKNPEKGGCKKDSAGTQERLLATRELWAEVQNKHLEKAGSAERVTHLSLKAQGIARQPEKHLGPVDAREVNAAALLERRAAERELAHVGREPINAAAELAEQARAAEAARQAIQAAQETAARQAAQVQAQREAAGRAAAEQAAQAQAQAAAEQQAAEAIRQAQAQAQARAAAETKEKENDRVRAAALGALAKSSKSTDRAIAFAVSDHSGIADHLQAASGNLGRAVEGTRRRVDERRYGRAVEAVRGQFERVGGVVRQVAGRVREVVRTVALALVHVEITRRKKLEREAKKPEGIAPQSRYHPDNIAKRAAQEAAAPGKPAPLTTSDLAELARAEKKRASAARLDADIEARKVAPPQPFDAAGKKAQWDAAIKAERVLYLRELTAQAHAKAVAGVAEHQAHVDAKPLLLGRQKWEETRQRFESRDAANGLEWQNLRDGRYPFTEREKEATQKAVERRVGEKNPELMGDMPKVLATLLEARKQAEALAREQQAKVLAAQRAQEPKTPSRGMGR